MNPGQNGFCFLPNATYQEVQHCFYSEKFISIGFCSVLAQKRPLHQKMKPQRNIATQRTRKKMTKMWLAASGVQVAGSVTEVIIDEFNMLTQFLYVKA